MEDQLKDQLLKRSVACAQRAIHHYLNDEYEQFLIQSATSFEQLGKAKLAAINVCLIIDRDFDSLLHVCAAGKHTKRAPWNLKTINATEVLKRCTQIQPGLIDFGSRLGLLAEFRNSAIHLGEIVQNERKEIFHTFLASTSLMVDEMGISRKDFFGEYEGLVATHLDQSAAEVNLVVAEKIARAQTYFQNSYGALEPAHAEAIFKFVESAYDPAKYEQDLILCPACEHLGLVSGSFDVEWEADFDDDGLPVGAYPVVTLTPSTYNCNLCRLSLDDSNELKTAGLPMPLEIKDVNASDFYEEPPQDYG
jgi:hypothetical protein